MFSRLIPTAKSDPELAPCLPGLKFGFFNAMTWQIAIGTPMVLFAEELGASPFQVGLAYSFIFLLSPLQILATALLSRYGYRTVILGGWATRTVFLVVPVWLAVVVPRWGVEPWMSSALVGSVFGFSFCRSIGAVAIMPWLYAIVPEQARGRYFGSDQFFSGIAGVGTLLACTALFALLEVYTALLLQYGLAILGSYLSFVALRQLPTAPNPAPVKLGQLLADTPRLMFRRSPFRHYLWLAVWFAVMATPVPPFLAYYLKVVPQLDPGQIMGFEVLRYLGVIAAAAVIRRRIDHTGARPFFLLCMVLYVGFGVFWWSYLQGAMTGLVWVYAAYFVLGLSAASWTIANLNYLAQVVDEKNRALMTAVFGAVTACCGGISPVLWGLVLKTEGPAGSSGMDVSMFQVFFLIVLASVVLLSSLMARLPEDKGHPVESLIIGNAVLKPFRAATYLVHLIDLKGPGRKQDRPAKD